MKKLFFLLLIIIITIGGYYFYNNIYIPSTIPTIEPEKNKVNISKYYIYGTHLNIEGSIKRINAKFKDIDLILWNPKIGKPKKYKINYSKNINAISFNITDEINNGIYIDNIEKGDYELYLRFTYLDKKEKKYKYYSLDNNTEYNKSVYYTTTKHNKKVIISKNDSTMTIKIKENKDKNIYDIVIDPAHGGTDKGAKGNGYYESDIVMEYAMKLKEKLDSKNIKVKLTRTKESLKDNDYFDEYNDGGRAVIAKEVNAKYLFSLTANNNTKKNNRGFRIDTAVGINYNFAYKLVENITKQTGIQTSESTYTRVDYGIYSHNFTEREINENMAYYKTKGYKPYKITTNSNYNYMIRESGGIITGSYVDDSNPEKVGINKYHNSNIGVEAYIINLGYLTNNDDISIITNKQDIYIEAIANSIIEELK